MTTTTTANKFTGAAGTVFHAVTGWATGLPSEFWLIAFLATAGLLIVAFILGRRAAYRLGQHRAGVSPGQSDDNNNDNNDNKRRDKQLLAATIIPAGLFWIAVLIGSGRGLTGFGEDTLHWNHGWQFLVPATLDGVAITFAFLAFRALWKKRNPDRARRIVWGATAASAFLNFAHELIKPDGAVLGALYLGILSIFTMALLDEFLRQFEEGAGYIKREKPVFGLRWITLPYPTLCAWLAWTNYPPAPIAPKFDEQGREIPQPITIGMAIEHLDVTRVKKAEQRNERDARRSTLPAWTRVAPWVRARKLQAMLDRSTRSTEQMIAQRDEEHRRSVEQIIAQHRTDTDRIVAKHQADLDRVLADRGADQADQDERIRIMEQAIREANERADRLANERAAEADQARSLADQLAQAGRLNGDTRELLQSHGEQLAAAERKRADLSVQIERLSGDLQRTRSEADEKAKRSADLEQVLREKEQITSDLVRQLEAARRDTDQAKQAAMDQVEQIKALQIALSDQSERIGNVRSIRSADRPARRSVSAEVSDRPDSDRSKKRDLKHLIDLFAELDPMDLFEPDTKGWTQRAVNKITQAGFGPTGRANRLIQMATTHVNDCSNETHDGDCIAPGYDPADLAAAVA